MFAIIKSGGKQFKIKKEMVFKVPLIEGEVGTEISINDVLLIQNEDGSTKVGTPSIEGAKVNCKIIEKGLEKKVIVYKFKRRKSYHKKQGHRQSYTKLLVQSIAS